MKIDIKTNPHLTTWDRLLATWERADEVDLIEGAWVFDHFYPIGGDTDGPCLEAWTTLTALAQATERLLLGSMVNAMPYRHPAVTAKMAATLDIVSGGRFQLGLGAGWNKLEADAYGISLGDTLKDRMDMFDEGVEVIVRLLTEDVTDFDGSHFQLSGARNEPKGPQHPHPPITIGGGGERRTLRTAARWAQHWNLTPKSIEEWRHKRDVLHRHCADLGRDPSEIMCSMMFSLDPADTATLYEKLREAQDDGLDKAVINLASPQDPAHVDVVADVASRLT